jgi:uncharacterized membrane protein
MRNRLSSLFGALRSSYWFIPTLMTLLSAVLAIAMIRLDQGLQLEAFRSLGFVYFNQPDGARALVSTVASSMITVAGTTFSITLAVLSLTSGQFGPRLLNTFMRDLGNQIVLGTFVSTFVYCLLVLRTIHSDGDTVGAAFVPHLSVLLVILFALASLGVFIFFIHHTASSIQASTITARIAHDLEKLIAKLPERGGADAPLPRPEGEGTLVYAKSAGYLQDLDEGALLDAAEKHGLVLEVLPAFGTFLLPGGPLLRVFGDPTGLKIERLERHFALGPHRNAGRDVDFLFSQLTEMALRALSPSMNDAVTAMRCTDRVAQGLLLLEGRALSGQRQRDGALRLLLPEPEPAVIARFSFGETRRFSADNMLYSKHLLATIGKLLPLTEREALRRALFEEAELIVKGAKEVLLPDDFSELEACYRDVRFSRVAQGAPTLRA